MLCDKCKQREARIRYTYTLNGVGNTVSLCEQCYDAMGNKDSLFEGWLFPGAVQPKINEKKCDLCGYTYHRIAQEGRVGCARCYSTFKTELMPQLARIHGNKTYTEPSPQKEVSELDTLQKQMEQAVLEENFELAAELRDKIKKMREETK